jgi:hypothetical protein
MVTRNRFSAHGCSFRDYRLRVAAVVRGYGMSERREQAPADSRAIYDVSD